jgi:hypothetical protein
VRIGTSQIAQLLEVSEDTALRMCRDRVLKTAARKTPGRARSPWTADRAEVIAVRDQSQARQVSADSTARTARTA